MKITQANVQLLLPDALDRLAFSLGENSDCTLQYYNLGAMISRAVIEAASNQFCELESGAEVETLTQVESQIADGLVAGVNSFSSEYGVEVLAHSKKDCYGGYFQ
jgi:hypothetical protein